VQIIERLKMSALIKLEGQIIPVEDAIAADDELIKKALLPFYPEVGNALISRTQEDGNTVISVLKRAGTKGVSPFEVLVGASESVNPAIALAWEIKRLEAKGELEDPIVLLRYSKQIDQAIEQGENEASDVARSRAKLQTACPKTSTAIIVGF